MRDTTPRLSAVMLAQSHLNHSAFRRKSAINAFTCSNTAMKTPCKQLSTHRSAQKICQRPSGCLAQQLGQAYSLGFLCASIPQLAKALTPKSLLKAKKFRNLFKTKNLLKFRVARAQ